MSNVLNIGLDVGSTTVKLVVLNKDQTYRTISGIFPIYEILSL